MDPQTPKKALRPKENVIVRRPEANAAISVNFHALTDVAFSGTG